MVIGVFTPSQLVGLSQGDREERKLKREGKRERSNFCLNSGYMSYNTHLTALSVTKYYVLLESQRFVSVVLWRN